MQLLKCTVFTLAFFPFFVVFAHADTIVVPDDCPTIQGAIDAAVNGDTIIVRAGTYVENIDFIGMAIHLKSEMGPDVTVIDGNHAGSVVTCQSGEDEETILDGFTITNGEATDSCGGMYNLNSSPTVTNCSFTKNMTWKDGGGGMYNENSNSTVTNCIFTGNSTGIQGLWSGHGGGMANSNSSSPIVSDCTFFENFASSGGGMVNDGSNPTVTNCIFYNNSCGKGYGGGMANSNSSSPIVSDCTFIGNYAWDGGGIYNSDSHLTVSNCTFSENSAGYYGGGMLNGGASPAVSNCIFSGNYSGIFGGGMLNSFYSNPTVTNCIFSGNSSATHGGGMANFNSSSPTVTNCTFAGNYAWGEGGGLHNRSNCSPIVVNSVLWNNNAPEGPEIWIGDSGYPSTLTISYSDVKGGEASVYVELGGSTLNWGSGMIDSDPLFVDPANGDLHLTFNSPCHGSGDNSAVIEPYDFEGDPRIAYGTVDMGADEFYTHLYMTGNKTPGGAIKGKFVGLPGTSPVGLFIGSNVLPSPINTMWGEYWLQAPWFLFLLYSIPSNGLLKIPTTLPGSIPAPYDIPMQALIGLNADSLTNVCLVEVR